MSKQTETSAQQTMWDWTYAGVLGLPRWVGEVALRREWFVRDNYDWSGQEGGLERCRYENKLIFYVRRTNGCVVGVWNGEVVFSRYHTHPVWNGNLAENEWPEVGDRAFGYSLVANGFVRYTIDLKEIGLE